MLQAKQEASWLKQKSKSSSSCDVSIQADSSTMSNVESCGFEIQVMMRHGENLDKDDITRALHIWI